jgi:hypothetical protein
MVVASLPVWRDSHDSFRQLSSTAAPGVAVAATRRALQSTLFKRGKSWRAFSDDSRARVASAITRVVEDLHTPAQVNARA